MATTLKIGDFVEVDATGTGEPVTGTITEVSPRKVRIRPEDGTAEINIYSKYVSRAKRAAAPADVQATSASKGDTMAKQKAKKAKSKAKTKGNGKLINADLDAYKVSNVKTSSGRKSIDCGDKVAGSLRGKDLEEVYKIASEKTGETVKALKTRFGHLNPGMQRMNLGNKIRATMP